MKTKSKKKFWLQAVFLGAGLITLTSAGTAHAAGYWTISNYRVHGSSWSSYGIGNTKQTSSNAASFNGDVLPGGNSKYEVRLINADAKSRSYFVNLYKDQTTRAYNNTGLKGYTYYADPRAKWHDVTDVKLHFSSDYK